MSQPYEAPRTGDAVPGTPLGAPDLTATAPAAEEVLLTPDAAGRGEPIDTPSATFAQNSGDDGDGKATAAKEQAAGVAQDAKQQAAGVAADAKEQAAGVAADARAGGQQVADATREEVRQVAAQVSDQARTVFANARTEFTHQVNTQQNRLAEVIRGLGDELGALASGQPAPANSQGYVAELAGQAAGRLDGAASYLTDRQPNQVLDELTRFARRRPGTFLLLAGLTGLVAGRVTRGLADDARRHELPARASTTPPVGYGDGTSHPIADYSMSDTAAMPTGYGAAVPPPVTEPDVHRQER